MPQLNPDGTMAQTPSIPPPAPPANVNQLGQEQTQYAQDFANNLPNTQRQLASNLAQQSANQVNSQVKAIKASTQSRGLGYGGLSQGMQEQAKAQGNANLVQGIGNMNANLENASNTLSTQAIQTGVGIQQANQAIQNQVYQQAVASQQASNTEIGGLIGTVATIGAIALL